MNTIWLKYVPFATKLVLLQCLLIVAQGSKVRRGDVGDNAYVDYGPGQAGLEGVWQVRPPKAQPK
jgi:hypothetical protein